MQRSYDFAISKLLLQARNRQFYLSSCGFKPFPWQSKVVSSKAKRKIINGARQSGKSTIVAGIPAHTARFYPGSLSIIGAPTENQANETILKVMQFIQNDKDYPKVNKWSTEEIMLDNGSRIIVRPANSATFRGYSKPRVIILDEASRIMDEAYTSGVRPMLTDNPDCELIAISTPYGREGFFYRAFTGDTKNWERYEIRSPYTVLGEGSELYLHEIMKEEIYQRMMGENGIYAWFSPRHKDFEFQQEQLEEMHKMQYLQEYGCEFIEKNGQVFSYAEIDDMFKSDIQPLSCFDLEVV